MENKISKIFCVGGLLYGDEAKGTTVEYLVKHLKSTLVVRYNGGPQAAHHIVLSDKKTFHCFSQFSSGSFFPTCHTLLSKFMLISPHTLLVEAEKLINQHNLTDIMNRLHIDYECFIITPYHQMLNRISEILRGRKKHGSTGLGVGICADEAYFAHKNNFPLGEIFFELDKEKKKIQTTLQIKELSDPIELRKKIIKIIDEKISQAKNILNDFMKSFDTDNEDKRIIINDAYHIFYEVINTHTTDSLSKFYFDFHSKYNFIFCNGKDFLASRINKAEDIVFEGAQGSLLDRVYGIFPHLTKTLCSDDNAKAILKEIEDDKNYLKFKFIKIGVLRAYSSRHGNGPFITHNKEYSLNNLLPEEHNSNTRWQGEFKVGPFDFVAAEYGIQIFKPDYLSITCIDKLSKICEKEDGNMIKIPMCTKYVLEGSSLTQDELEILKNEDLFKIENEENANNNLNNNNNNESNQLFKISRIKKRKIEKTYCNLDLNKILSKAEPIIEKIFVYSDTINTDNTISNTDEKLLKEIYNFDKINSQTILTFLSNLENKLNIPISIISLGPTHEDKIIFNTKIFD
jgi:adenylosuccinate synthase